MISNVGNTVVEMESFIMQAGALWSATELDDLKDYVARNPVAGDEIPGRGGLRKLRWGRTGMGKRGGARFLGGLVYSEDLAFSFACSASGR
jgi:hypothetical protein